MVNTDGGREREAERRKRRKRGGEESLLPGVCARGSKISHAGKSKQNLTDSLKAVCPVYLFGVSGSKRSHEGKPKRHVMDSVTLQKHTPK